MKKLPEKLPEKALRTAVVELLVKKIGMIWEIESLKKFDIKDKISPRICFLGKNKITNRLHWIFINDYYKIANFKQLGSKEFKEKIQTTLNKWNDENPNDKEDAINPTIIPIECALATIKDIMRDKLILNPSLFLESPAKPQSYPENSDVPIVYKSKNDSMKTDERNKIYKGKLGLSMRALVDNEVYFSPYSILDPRSYEPGFWDVLLGIEQTLYLPINVFENKELKIKGVLVISFNEGEIWANAKKISELIKELWININKETRSKKLKESFNLKDYEIIKSYKYLTEDKAEKIKDELTQTWKNLMKEPEIQNGIKILLALFTTSLEFYHKYTFNFDDYIIEQHKKNYQSAISKININETLEKMKTMQYDSINLVSEYIESLHDKVQTLKYVMNLEKVEPLLQAVGKKEHFIHMFNVYLLGKILWKIIFSDPIRDGLWKEIAFSHDLAYPIEAIQEEIEEFFRVYFHPGKTPIISIPKTLFYSYGNFPEYFLKLICKASEHIKTGGVGDFSSAEILEDLVLYNLYTRSDHAVISALFTLHANERRGYKYKKAIPILLHNLYQWKYFQLKEIKKVFNRKKNVLKISHSSFGDEDEYEFEIDKDYPFLIFIFERRLEKELKDVSKNNNEKEIFKKFRKIVRNYQDNLLQLRIPISENSDKDKTAKYIFILSLADFLQEWGRFTFIDKGLASIGLRLSQIERNKIALAVPFLESNDYLQPTNSPNWNIENAETWYLNSPQTFGPFQSFRDFVSKFVTKSKVINRTFYEKAIKDEIKSRAKRITLTTKTSDNHFSEAAMLAWLQSINKLWEYMYKFSLIPSTKDKMKEGLFEYEGKLLTLEWKNIKHPTDNAENFKWPPNGN